MEPREILDRSYRSFPGACLADLSNAAPIIRLWRANPQPLETLRVPYPESLWGFKWDALAKLIDPSISFLDLGQPSEFCFRVTYAFGVILADPLAIFPGVPQFVPISIGVFLRYPEPPRPKISEFSLGDDGRLLIHPSFSPPPEDEALWKEVLKVFQLLYDSISILNAQRGVALVDEFVDVARPQRRLRDKKNLPRSYKVLTADRGKNGRSKI